MRWLTLSVSVVLILTGPIVGMLPGPGGILLFGLGLLLAATESELAARLLDWSEPRVLRGWKWIKRYWKRLSTVNRLGWSALLITVVVAFGLFGYAIL